MRIMLVSPEPSDYASLQTALKDAERPTDNIFHYAHPLKALDNLEELSPDIVFWSAESFPRHWKLLAPLSDSAPQLVLFADAQLNEKETEKAEALGVAGIVQTGISGSDTRGIITEVLRPQEGKSSPRTMQAPEAISELQYVPQKDDALALAMTHPSSLKLIHGKVLTLTPDSILFKSQKDMTDIPSGTLVKGCHLKAGDRRLELDMTVQHFKKDCYLVIQEPEKEYLQLFEQLVEKKAVPA